MKDKLKFIDPGDLIDGDLELILMRKTQAIPAKRYVPGYEFEMRHPGRTFAMGTIRLRIGSAAKLHYPGHIGYEVKKRFRGHRYAARSCQLLFPLARAHGLGEIWLSVEPKNGPSQRTCEIIGAKYIETVRIPKGHEMYALGKRYCRRYLIDLRKVLSNIRFCRREPG